MTDIYDTTLMQCGAREAFDYAADARLSAACCQRMAALVKIAPEAV